MDKLIIEVRVNEYAPRESNRLIPFTADELGRDAAAVHNAGASIVHFHPRQPDGAPAHALADYEAAITQIRRQSGVLINPTLGQITVGGSALDRLRPIEALARSPLLRPELCGIDPGSTNIDVYDSTAQRFRSGDRVYANSHDTLQHFCRRLRELGIKPALACWSIPFVRSACALIDMGLIDDPPYFFFVCGEGGTLGAHPATPEGLRAFTDHLPRHRNLVWSVGCKGGNLFPLAMAAIAAGGHVAIGIGDFPIRNWANPRMRGWSMRWSASPAWWVARSPPQPRHARCLGSPQTKLAASRIPAVFNSPLKLPCLDTVPTSNPTTSGLRF